MEYQYWNRPLEHFEDFEKDAFTSREVRLPERILLSSAILASDRKQDQDEYEIEKNLLNHGGCYLFFDSYQYQKPTKFFSIYVGRTNSLKKRLGAHWGVSENFITDYQDAVAMCDKSLMRTGVDHNKYPAHKLLPTGLAWVAFWYEENEKERMFFEHELIYKFRPMYNKD